ncbi:hypothetical protein [Spirilliplanes yamanashiensis]|uniref:Integral membrane protein n=1 Tax=Spirilliplanes yamanashiensis TaxID=42233 RepID=A0A8J3Y4Q2_9ACTN|nr:hypothetical protein [Spirilliplanes yamanashiensis]MDP9819733.1 hypothetical protein [Spirilliplanes yamanashiensis]GIJ01447.1 hypothetical protein Sya03_07990 [Spirilliplanes yamanashiensis]
MSAPVAELTRRLPDGGADIVDVHDAAAALTALGVTDHTARARYGLPSLHALSRALLAHLARGRWAPLRPRPHPGPAALAARWAGPAAALVASWPVVRPLGAPAAAALLLVAAPAGTGLGFAAAAVRARAGRAAAARLLAGGFAVAGALWCLASLRFGGTAAGLVALAGVAALTAAPVLGGVAELLRWGVPLSVLAAVQLTPARLDDGTAARVAAAALVLAAARLLAPAAAAPREPAGAWRTALAHGLGGLAAAAAAVWLWRTFGWVAAVPLLAAVPAADALAGWHAAQRARARAAAESVRAYRRRLRRLAVTTAAGLLPLPAVGGALFAAAHRTARDAVLALSAGCLLGGVLTVAAVLAARGRPLLGTTVAAAAPLAASGAYPHLALAAATAAGLLLTLRRGRPA